METINVKHLAFNQYDSVTFKSAIAEMYKLTGQTSKQFNQLVRDSVYYFYHTGNHQVDIVNQVLKVAHQAKGFNHSALLLFFQQVIPHQAVQATKKTVDGKVVKTPPRFGSLDKKQKYDWEAALDFLAHNPHWSDFAKEIPSTMFDPTKYADIVALRLVREGANLEEFVTKLKADYAVAVDKKAKKQA